MSEKIKTEEVKAEESQEKKAGSFKWVWISMAPVVVALGVWWYFHGEATGTIHKGAVQTETKAIKDEKVRFNGKYLSFAHSSKYKPTASENAAEDKDALKKEKSSFLDSVLLVSYSSIFSKKLAMSVQELPSGNLEDNASYKMRLSKPSVYVKSTLTVNNENVDVFTSDADVKEQGVFLRHNGIIVSVVLSSTNDSLENMRDELSTIVKSIEWKKID